MKPARSCLALAVAIALSGCGSTNGNLSGQDNAVADERRDANAAAPAPQTHTDATPQPVDPPQEVVSACLAQDGNPVPDNAIRAVGTEPFWAAGVNGRCVTYSTPEDQQGTRVWTRFEGTAANGTWTGALDGQPFVMTTTPQAGCSDGMSDKRYPIAVSLAVRGEERRGCAERSGD